MTKEAIIETGISYISQSLEGLSVENPKFDFKAKWYNLKDEVERNEFLKDTCAIANTFGPDGFIVIGFDDKKKEFENSPLSESGLRDSSDIPGMINRHVDRLFLIDAYEFKFDGNILTILHIPPSIDKPHVIRCYKSKSGKDELNKIFIRRNTSTAIPSKNDFELMFYDRKNIMPEYQAYVSLSTGSITSNANELVRLEQVEGALYLTVENSGRRPLPIKHIMITLSVDLSESQVQIDCKDGPTTIRSGDVQVLSMGFRTINMVDTRDFKGFLQYFRAHPERLAIKTALIMLENGNLVRSDMNVFG